METSDFEYHCIWIVIVSSEDIAQNNVSYPWYFGGDGDAERKLAYCQLTHGKQETSEVLHYRISWYPAKITGNSVKFMINLASYLHVPPNFFRVIVFYSQRQSINNVTYTALQNLSRWVFWSAVSPEGFCKWNRWAFGLVSLEGFCMMELRRQLFLPSTESWVLDSRNLQK
jgi:hypothetical protein